MSPVNENWRATRLGPVGQVSERTPYASERRRLLGLGLGCGAALLGGGLLAACDGSRSQQESARARRSSEPWVAESWGKNPENTEFWFKIRKGLTFSDGTPLT